MNPTEQVCSLTWRGPSGTGPAHTHCHKWCTPLRTERVARHGSPAIDRQQGVHGDALWLMAQPLDMARSTSSQQGGWALVGWQLTSMMMVQRLPGGEDGGVAVQRVALRLAKLCDLQRGRE
jgi:hypothetical protein